MGKSENRTVSMKTFDALYNSVMQNELGYNPNDQGAPTYNGIWRKAWPLWEGWALIDKISGKKRGQTFYDAYPELEELTKKFYSTYWMPVQVNKLTDLRMAQMLVDMATQHGRWKKIVYAGIYGGNPLAANAPAVYGKKEIDFINADTAAAYKKIAEKRLFYSSNVFLKNEADRKGIVNRAKKYLAIAAKWAAGSAAAGSVILLAAAFFF